MRFAVVFRAERKKILHNQIHLAIFLINVLEKLEKLQTQALTLSEEEVDIKFDDIILEKTEFEHTEPSELGFYKRRLYMRQYLGDLRKVISVYKEMTEQMNKTVAECKLQNKKDIED
jgi:anion-transporting  ArsA/GET3 family ATPase